jgi:ATP-dependent Lon protease
MYKMVNQAVEKKVQKRVQKDLDKGKKDFYICTPQTGKFID